MRKQRRVYLAAVFLGIISAQEICQALESDRCCRDGLRDRYRLYAWNPPTPIPVESYDVQPLSKTRHNHPSVAISQSMKINCQEVRSYLPLAYVDDVMSHDFIIECSPDRKVDIYEAKLKRPRMSESGTETMTTKGRCKLRDESDPFYRTPRLSETREDSEEEDITLLEEQNFALAPRATMCKDLIRPRAIIFREPDITIVQSKLFSKNYVPDDIDPFNLGPLR